MTPEELAAYREWLRIMEFKDNAWPCMALTHIDQQATLIKELDDAVSGPLENIAKMLETVNADTIFSGIIQTWKNENGTLKTRIAELEAQVAALQEIAITATSRTIYEECQGDCGRVICSPEKHKKDARRRLSEEYPEVFG
jgi:ribonuclease I